jgi:hypothetical protein
LKIVQMTELTPVTTLPPANTKPVTLVLAWYLRDYKVTAVQNTTFYKPGMWLTVELVQKLCDLPGWTVQMADNDLLGTLLGLVPLAARTV